MITLLILMLAQVAAGDTALVILDMQSGMIERFGSNRRPPNVAILAELGRRQRQLIDDFKSRDLPILLVELEGGGETLPELKDSALLSRRSLFIKKTTNSLLDDKNASRAAVLRFFEVERVSDLVVIGANGSACVASTVYDALREGLPVTVVREAISDFDFETFWYPFTFRNFAGFRVLFALGLREVESPADVFE